MDNITYKEIIMGFSLISYILRVYLSFRQYRVIIKPKPNTKLYEELNKIDYEAVKAYSLDKWKYDIVNEFYEMIFLLCVLGFDMVSLIWNYVANDILGPKYSSNEILISIIFIFIISLINTIRNLPWELYYNFVIEGKHGFNNQSLIDFIIEKIKMFLITMLLLPLVSTIVIIIMKKSGFWMPLYLWLFTFVFSIIMMTIYPIWIAPLFNTFEPLDDDELREKIEKLAKQQSYPLSEIYLMDGSRQSAHSNAYLYGFYKNKRIVIYDTLMQQCDDDEIVAVLAHELGHWKLSHVIKNFIGMNTVTLIQFILFSLVRYSRDLYESFGFYEFKPQIIAIYLFSLLFGPLDEVVSFVFHYFSRLFEYQADTFAFTIGHGKELRKALIILNEKNKSMLESDPWYSAFHHSHPSTYERIQALDLQTKKKE